MIKIGRDYINTKTDESFHANISGTNFLANIMFGYFEKIGCHPRSVKDCRLIARVLRNRIKLNKWWQPHWKELYDTKKLSKQTITWMAKGVKFFENIKNINNLEIY